ncbi:MAG: glutathione S-transferase family protein [Pseudomonadota bacterium]
MKLHEFNKAPNSRRVHIFMAEKGVEIPRVEVDILGAENLSPAFKEKNPMGRIPVLELDNGRFIAESVAICRYLEETNPSPLLFGSTPESKATVEMWNRRAELSFLMPVAQAFRNLSGAFKDRETCNADWGEISKTVAAEAVPAFEAQLASTEYLAGDSVSIADITFLVSLDFARRTQVYTAGPGPNVARWYELMQTRSSTGAQ